MTEPSNDAVHSDALYNHMPRLSVVAFTDSLAAFSANLDDSLREIQNRCHNSDGEISRSKDYVFSEADHFLKEQHARLQNIERSLLQRAEDIVPVNKDLMTAAELVQICQNLNRMNLDFARYLDPRITRRTFDAGVSKINTTTQQMDISGRIESTGRDSRLANNEHLHSVAEADYETDATTTPGSTFVGDPSSALELMSTRLSDASRLASIISDPSDFIETWRSRMSSLVAKSHSEAYNENEHTVGEMADDHTGRTNAWRALESRSEPNASDSCQVRLDTSDDHISLRTSDSGHQVKADLAGYSSVNSSSLARDDESVSLAPTVKGHGFFKKQALEHLINSKGHTKRTHKSAHPDAPIRELVVEEQVPICFPYNDITFDQSMMDDSPPSPSQSRIRDAGDESLLVTPVLARYRLEPDDSSIGVKVVPTGRHRLQHAHKVAKRSLQLPASQQPKSVCTKTRRPQENSLRVIPRPGKENNLPNIGEALSPNISVRTPIRKEAFAFVEDVFTAKEVKHPPEGRRKHQLSYAKESHVDDLETFESKKGCKPLSGRRQTADVDGVKHLIAAVSSEEYEAAPSVVKMQVGLDEVNDAVQMLNSWFSARSASKGGSCLNEKVASSVLDTSLRKGMILLMSLCHWRRMNMAMDDATGFMHFVPNEKVNSRFTM